MELLPVYLIVGVRGRNIFRGDFPCSGGDQWSSAENAVIFGWGRKIRSEVI